MVAAAALSALLTLGGYCTDRDPSCGAWAEEGECDKNPYRMIRTCPHACGQCELIAYDTRDECPTWAAKGECDSNVDFMLKNCPTSCGVCAPACEDRLQECAGFAHLGECLKNPGFMLRNCPVACGACVQVGTRESLAATSAWPSLRPALRAHPRACLRAGVQEPAVGLCGLGEAGRVREQCGLYVPDLSRELRRVRTGEPHPHLTRTQSRSRGRSRSPRLSPSRRAAATRTRTTRRASCGPRRATVRPTPPS